MIGLTLILQNLRNFQRDAQRSKLRDLDAKTAAIVKALVGIYHI